ncbi:molybdopterin molybdotransferase MoeA [Parapedobacter soli]|uniref:molybdopterin molybdotransferase MoeA n=1 Tax=Parapedobacter soli TaxID=416955 RepID=UPI0021C9C429|nr:molybdopterin molybdotransferase MoeA [Parapedobacter soli]
MLKYLEAVSKIRGLASPFPVETVPLTSADNRVLARPVFADRDYPPFDRSAMDGIAIRLADYQQGAREFHIAETIFAGSEATVALEEGTCYRIMTGAPCPPSADAVVRNEDITYISSQQVRVQSEQVVPKQHIAQQGEDLTKGDRALAAPCRCDVSAIGTLAALGVNNVPVYANPSVAIVTTGNEVVDIGRQPNRFQIRNSNQYLLRSLCCRWGLPIGLCQHAPDDPAILRETLGQALDHHITIINGGVSAGDADYVPQVLADLGVETLFHKVLIKPGKPILVGTTPNGGIVFALPGNPLSCLVTFKLFVEEYLWCCYGFAHTRLKKAQLLNYRPKKTSLDEFFPVFREIHTDGYTWRPHHGSGDITAAVGCDGIGWHPQNRRDIKANEVISILSLSSF